MPKRGTGAYSQLRVWVKRNGPCTLKQAQEAFQEIMPKTVNQHLIRLADKGSLVRLQDGRYADSGKVMYGSTTGFSIAALQAAWPAWGPPPARIEPTRVIGLGLGIG